jgi:regulator of protease activity HflC (stomatin/prohibitin superfamily)
MAELRNLLFLRHLRSDASAHVLHHSGGALKRSGTGLSFWFLPLSASIAEVPTDDRELTLLVHTRSLDFQDVTVQGVVSYRVVNPLRIASRVDFTLDLGTGRYVKQPLEKLELLISQLVQQHAAGYVAGTGVREVLTHGHEAIRERVATALAADEELAAIGLAVVSVRISAIAPTPELERALEAPARERIQQESDEAVFSRRALAVEKERAIAENELHNRIELARREENLIAQEGQNARRKATEDAEAARIGSEAEAARTRLDADVQADRTRVTGAANAASIRDVEGARAEAERVRMEAYAQVPPAVLAALAARELAGKLQKIEHLNLSPDALTPLLQDLLSATARRVGAGS